MTTAATASFDQLRRCYQADLQARLGEQVGRLGWSREQIAGHQRRELRRLLAHASERSPFHARRLAGIDPDRFELDALASLPVMTKAEMMEHFDDAVTDRRLTLGSVEAHLATCIERPEFFAGEYLCLASGGSSGTRGVFVLDWEAATTFMAAVLAPGIGRMLAGGGTPPGGLVAGIVAAPAAIHATCAGTVLLDGVFGRIVHAPVTLPLPEIVARLNEGQPHLLASYPSMLRLLVSEQQSGRLAIAPRAIITTSEQLPREVAEDAARAFGVPVSDSFGSTEGLVGSSDPGGEAIAFASDLAIVELVDEENRPVPPGTPSHRVLLTNLYNFAQPLIRYELPDSFVRQPDAPGHGHLRALVAGRADDVFVYGDRAIHPLVIRSPLVKEPAVTEYRVRQAPRGVDVDVVVDRPIDERALAGALADALREAGLTEPDVRVGIVERIERHAETGKVRRFIPLQAVAPGS